MTMEYERLELHPNDKIGSFTVVQLLMINIKSTLYLGIDENTQQKVVIATRDIKNEAERELVRKEISLVESLSDNKYIIHYIHHSLEPRPGFAFVAMPFYAHGDVIELLSSQDVIPEDFARQIIFQTLLALKSIHSRNIIHHMVTPEKILIESDNPLKIVLKGFQFAEQIQDGEPCFSQVGSLPYLAPEILRQDPHDIAVDMWSLGVIAFTLLTHELPFHIEDVIRTPIEQIFEDQERGPNYSLLNLAGRSPQSIHFIRQALTFDPQNRINVFQAIQHPWFAGLVDDAQ